MNVSSLLFQPFCLEFPKWIPEFLAQQPEAYPTPESRMELVLMLAQLNIRYGTGGPFGAGVFRKDTQQLVAPGVNLVPSSNSSIAHAEIIAIVMAQQVVGSYDLGASGLPSHELVTSCQPCGMCLGAISWSGIRQVVCGARGSDAEAVGFDEGPKPADWTAELEQRGITVILDVSRTRASAVLQQYIHNGGAIYNGRQG
jgi:tRNA(Arg) A34 adenosine deaminase TadA